jgi:hypothetical protein
MQTVLVIPPVRRYRETGDFTLLKEYLTKSFPIIFSVWFLTTGISIYRPVKIWFKIWGKLFGAKENGNKKMTKKKL